MTADEVRAEDVEGRSGARAGSPCDHGQDGRATKRFHTAKHIPTESVASYWPAAMLSRNSALLGYFLRSLNKDSIAPLGL